MKDEQERQYTELLDRLRNEGYRITPQRAAVISILLHRRDHPSVEQVYVELKEHYPMASLATVYKTVDLLKKIHSVLEIGLADAGSRYDALNPIPHPHLICVRCKKILDPQVELFRGVEKELEVKYGYKITQQRLDFFGLCPDCQSEELIDKELTG